MSSEYPPIIIDSSLVAEAPNDNTIRPDRPDNAGVVLHPPRTRLDELLAELKDLIREYEH